MPEKYIGHSLLISGLLLIVFSAFSVYTVFTGKMKPAPLFNFPAVNFSANQLLDDSKSPVNFVADDKIEVVSKELLNDTSNVLAHMFLMGFLASIGARIAEIGTKLMRPINVKLQETK